MIPPFRFRCYDTFFKSFYVLISGDRDSKEVQKPLETCTESDGLQTGNGKDRLKY